MLIRGLVVIIEIEDFGNGKVRVSIEVEGKVVIFDWKVDQKVDVGRMMGLGMGSISISVCLYFGMRFSYEDWKVGVE